MLLHLRSRAALLPLAMAAAFAAAEPAQACSTCKCADPTVSLLGVEKPYENRIRIGVEHLLRAETQGSGLERRETDEQRTLLGLAWSPHRDLTLIAQIPWVHKEITGGDLARQEAEGLGDIDLIGRYVLWREGGGSGRQLAGLRAGVRLPTAQQIRSGGEKLDIDVQPDAGSTVPNLGGWYAYYGYPWFLSASLSYFHFSNGHQGFSPGDAAVGSVLGQYALTLRFAVQLGIDARYAGRNQFSGRNDPDSGGTLAMAFAGAALRLFDDFVVNAGAQLPVLDELNGRQQEDPSLRLGIAYDF